MKKKILIVGLVIVLMAFAGITWATPLTVSASSGSLSAAAQFSVVGGNLQIVLTNTSLFDVMVPADVLTAIFFTISGDPALTPISALLAPGSLVIYNSQPSGGNVGGEWAYLNNLSGAPLGANQGISSSGFNLFGNANFGGPNLSGPAAVDGLQYGLVSAGDLTGTGNGGVMGQTGNQGLIHNSVIFTLGGLPSGFDPSVAISNVSFQYGTSLTDPNNEVPEPSTFVLLGSGLLGILFFARRKLNR